MVWQNAEVGKFAGKKFVSLRVTAEDEEYARYRKDFQVPGTPTVLFLDAQGNEIDRIVGFDEDEKDEYFQTVKDFAAGVNTLPALLAELEKKPEDADVNYRLAKRYLSRYESPKSQPYFEKVLELDPEDRKGYREEAIYEIAINQARAKQNPEPLRAFLDSTPAEKYLYSAYTTLAFTYQRKKENDSVVATYEEAMGKMPDNARLMYSFASAIITGRMEAHYEKALDLNRKAASLDPDLEQSTYFNLIHYFQNLEQTDNVIETFEEAIGKFPDSTGMKSFFATTIVNSKIESHYDRGIELMEAVVEKRPKAAHYWHTLGQLHHLKGDNENAIRHVRKALELSPDTKAFQKTLEEIGR